MNISINHTKVAEKGIRMKKCFKAGNAYYFNADLEKAGDGKELLT
jgi:hypothetical protein